MYLDSQMLQQSSMNKMTEFEDSAFRVKNFSESEKGNCTGKIVKR